MWHAILRFLNRILTLDRRWIFSFMAICILVPLLLDQSLPFTTDPAVEAIYEAIEDLDAGDNVIVSCDYDPGSKPELQPFTEALFQHLFRKDINVVISCLWPAAPPLVGQAITLALEQEGIRDMGLEQGIDYVNLGYKDGRQLVMLSMGENIHSTFPVTYDGTPIGQVPLMRQLKKLGDFDLFINVSGGSPGTKEWVETAQGRFGLTMAASCTAVMAPDNIPYYESGQLIGLAGGMKGSADYETLVGIEGGAATKGMAAQSFGHLLIILFIFLGNVAYFGTRKRGGK